MQTKPRKLKRVVIKEELVELTGKVEQAIVLNQFIYWSERVKDIDAYLQEEQERVRKFSDGSVETEEEIKANLTKGWIYKTAKQMKEECMFDKSATTMERIMKALVDNGWLDRRRNPKYKWDKTWQYRVNIAKIQKDLLELGYALEGYSMPNNPKVEESNPQNEGTELQNEASKIQNEDSKVQNEDSKLQNEAAIPEITTDITNKEFDDDDNIYNHHDNKSYKLLAIHLHEKGLNKEIINDIIQEAINQKLYKFDLDDAVAQFDYMLDEIKSGQAFTAYHVYFVKGLVKRTNQKAMVNIDKLNRERERNNRDTSLYYDWLEE